MNITDLLGNPVHDQADPEMPSPPGCAVPPIDRREPQPAPLIRGRALLATATIAVTVAAAAGWAIGSRRDAAVTPETSVAVTAVVPADVAGAAEVLTATYLTGTVSAADFAVIYGGEPPLPSPVWVNATTIVLGERVTDSLWNITVAVDSLEAVDGVYEPAGLSYYVVPISTASGRPIASGAPGRVPPPTAAPSEDLFPNPVLPDQAATASHFVEQYLTGGDEITRYLSPIARIPNFSTPPYVTAVATPQGGDDHDRVRIAVAATNERGVTHQLEYTVSLTFNGEVWEVSDLVAGTA